MFMRKFLLTSVLIVTGTLAVAQDDPTERTSAELPETLDGQGERAPEPVPASSAEEVADISPDT